MTEPVGDAAQMAVLGMGTMGHAVAARLLDRGRAVTVWNRTPGRAGDLGSARVAGSIADAVRGAEVVLTVLTADDAVREVCLGEGGVRESLAPSAIVVDMSTVHPRTSREVAAALGEHRFSDAPILAGPATVTSGDALLIVGGTEPVVNRLRPLFGDLSARCVHGGPVGTGATLKLVFNLLFLEGLLALSECAALAQAAGVDADLLAQLLRTSPSVPAGLQNRLEDVLHGDHRGWFPIPLARKDIRLARELGNDSGLELRFAAAADDAYHRAEQRGHATDDVAAVVEAVRGARVATTPAP